MRSTHRVLDTHVRPQGDGLLVEAHLSRFHILHNLAVIQFNDLIAEVEIPIIVGNHDHQFPPRTQVRK